MDTRDDEGANAALPRDIQEQIGRRLRTELRQDDAKPSYLGETALPPQFEPLVRKLEASERGQRQGYEAVKAALLRKASTREQDGP